MNVLITAKAATGDSKVTYTISRENNITAFAKTKEAKSATDVERFATAKELAKLAEQWPAARLVDIWNAVPGVVRSSDSPAENGCGPSVGGHSEPGAECWRTAAPCGAEKSQSAPTGQPAGENAPSPRGQQESRGSGAAAP